MSGITRRIRTVDHHGFKAPHRQDELLGVADEHRPHLCVPQWFGFEAHHPGEQQGRKVASHACGEVDPGWESRVDFDELITPRGVPHEFDFQRAAPLQNPREGIRRVEQSLVMNTDPSPGFALVGQSPLLHHHSPKQAALAIAHGAQVVFLPGYELLDQDGQTPGG